MAIKINYDPIKYNALKENSPQFETTPWNLRSHNLQDLKKLQGRLVGNRFEFSYEYSFSGNDLENILRVHMPRDADGYAYWGTKKGNLRFNFYKIYSDD